MSFFGRTALKPAIQAACAAPLITFDSLAAGVTIYGYDGDADAVNDVIFSTADPFGFNTVGPGPNRPASCGPPVNRLR